MRIAPESLAFIAPSVVGSNIDFFSIVVNSGPFTLILLVKPIWIYNHVKRIKNKHIKSEASMRVFQ